MLYLSKKFTVFSLVLLTLSQGLLAEPIKKSAVQKAVARKHGKVVKANKVITDDLLVKKNAQFCGDVNISGNLTVNGDITVVRNRFHGWWRHLSKGNAEDYLDNAPQYIFINATDINNITAQGYGGTLEYAYEYEDPNSFSINQFPVVFVNDRVLGFLVDASQSTTVNGITGTYPNDFNFYFSLQEGGQYDGLGFMGNSLPAQNDTFVGSTQGDLYEKLNFDVAVGDQIRPWGNGDNAFVDSNSRRFMFEQINIQFFEFNMPALSPAGQAERLMERPERHALFDAIMNKGVERDPVALYSINKTTKGSGTTTLFTIETYPFVNFASKVRLSGLEGDWQILNDKEFQVVGAENTDNETVEEQAPFYLANTRTYHIVIKVDTTNLPAFNPTIHAPSGAIIQPSKVGPITEDLQYREWVDAAIYYTQRVMQQSTHSRFDSYAESLGSEFIDAIDSFLTKSPLATWEEVSNAILGTIPSSLVRRRYKTNIEAGSLICPAYYLPYWITFANIQINEPFTELGIPGSAELPEDFPEYAQGTLPILGFNVPFENYVLPESRRWLYFRVQPDTPVSNAQQENVWVLGYDTDGNLIPELRGYASVGPNALNATGQLGGSRLEGLMSAVPWGVDDPEIVDGFWSPYTFFDPFDPTTFNAGIINPELVDGHRIGYITFNLNHLHDPFSISLNINFGNPALASSPDPELRKRQQYDGESAIIAAMMRYFVEEQNVEAIIIDNRINGGNFNTQSFIESFGGAHKGNTTLEAFQNQDNRAPIDVDRDIEVFGGTRQDNRTIRKLIDTTPWPTVRPDLMELRYPGSVFKNGPVIILDSQSAGSGGDQFPRFFMGANFDGNLGNGVQTYIVGTIDGILQGFADFTQSLVRSKYGSEFPDQDGIGQSPLFFRAENLVYSNIGGAPTSTRFNPSTDFSTIIPALIPVNSNLRGPIYSSSNTGTPNIVQGALSTNIGDTVYFDFGYAGRGTAVNGTPYVNAQGQAQHWNNPPTGITQVDGFPGQPNPNDPASLRDSWLEEAIRVTRLALGDSLTRSEDTVAVAKKSAPSSISKQIAARYKTIKDVEARAKMIEERAEV